MKTIDRETYSKNSKRYELRKGKNEPNAPLCPYGNSFEWIGYDLETQEYVRFTKSVFKELVHKPS